MTPEGKVKNSIKVVLKQRGVYWFCPVQNGMGSPSLDFLCIHNSVGFGIEAKAPGKKATQRQLKTMEKMADSGGRTFVIDGPESLRIFEFWLIANDK